MILDSTSLGQVYIKRRGNYHARRITANTRVVIDGYPRSAGTFAWHATELLTDTHGVIAGHTHAASTVLAATRRHLPCILLVRSPRDAIASFMQFPNAPSLRHALREYIHFYSRVMPVINSVVVADFPRTTRHFGSVLDECRSKYNWPAHPARAFSLLDDAEIKRRIDRENILTSRSGRLDRNSVARPSTSRDSASRVFNTATVAELEELDTAQRIFSTILSLSTS